ncbi:MAG TPA: hypothetical protein VFE31_08320 [Opitutaceae bacterium]|jgi:hypothetical protein|nr:hypothetical protein [Opitutaceae bacterium]
MNNTPHESGSFRPEPSEHERELEIQTRIADARWQAIEEIQPAFAVLSACFAHLAWHHWIISVAVGIGVFFVLPIPYSKQSKKAWDDYTRVTKTGKYVDHLR